ncbi:hypothetical protein ACQH6E_01820 [Acinetobacter baumannii]
MFEVKTAVQFDDDDVWIGRVLISKCGGNDEWTAYLDNDVEKEFETLEQAVTYCLEQAND